MATSELSFTVRIARDGAELREACALRAQAYGHHLPGLAQSLAEPDAIDRWCGTRVLVCRDKASGALVGTARLQCHAGQQVPLAHAGGLPHSVLTFDVVAAERCWREGRHALYGFMVETWHPDLQLLAEPAPDSGPLRPADTALPRLRQAA